MNTVKQLVDSTRDNLECAIELPSCSALAYSPMTFSSHLSPATVLMLLMASTAVLDDFSSDFLNESMSVIIMRSWNMNPTSRNGMKTEDTCRSAIQYTTKFITY